MGALSLLFQLSLVGTVFRDSLTMVSTPLSLLKEDAGYDNDRKLQCVWPTRTVQVLFLALMG